MMGTNTPAGFNVPDSCSRIGSGQRELPGGMIMSAGFEVSSVPASLCRISSDDRIALPLMFDSTLGKARRIQQAIQLFIREVGHLASNLLHGTALLISCLGDCRAFLVANHRI